MHEAVNIRAHREGNARGRHGEHTGRYAREYKMDIQWDIPGEHIGKETHGEIMGTHGEINEGI